MLAAIACALVQASALGPRPSVWKSEQYGIQMSYPRSWKRTSSKQLQEENEQAMAPYNSIINNSRAKDDALRYLQVPPAILFAADDKERFPTHVQIYVLKSPPRRLTTLKSRWPHFQTNNTRVLKQLPHSALDEPIEIGNIRGYVTRVYGELVNPMERRYDSITVHFQTPAGEYIEFSASKAVFPGKKNLPEDEKEPIEPSGPTYAMERILPTLAAMLRSITFSKPKAH